MTIAYINSGGVNGALGGTSGTATLPGSRTNGNLLVAYIQIKIPSESISTPVGWFVIDAGSDGSQVSIIVGKFVVGGETDPAFSWTTSGIWHCEVVQWSGVDNAAPIGLGSGGNVAHASGNSTTLAISANVITTVSPNSVIGAMLFSSGNSAMGGSVSPYTARSSFNDAFASDTICDELLASSGTGSSALSVTVASAPWAVILFEMIEDTGGGGGSSAPSSGGGSLTGTLTWSRRNRLTETGALLAWDAADVTPETGQTTRVYVLDASDRSVITTISGITGTSTDLDIGDFGGVDVAIVRVVSVNTDGDESLEGYELIVQFNNVTGVSIAGTPLIDADLNNTITPYSFNVTASNGITAGRIFSLEGTWPPGIHLTQTSDTAATIEGTATVAGTYSGLTVRVTDANGDFDDLSTFSIEVVDVPYISTIFSNGFFNGPGHIDWSVVTDSDDGTIFWVSYPSSGHTLPSIAQVIAGQDETGSAATYSGSGAPSGGGADFSTDGNTPAQDMFFVCVQVITGPHYSNLQYTIDHCSD